MKRPFKLKRELGLLEVTLIGVGIIFGAGIYALIGKASSLSGNALWLSFAISALLAAFTGLSYAELSSMFPKAGAEYVYVENSFGERIAFFIGWLIIVSGVVAGATVSLGFAGYFSALFGGLPIFPIAAILLISLGLINFYGIKMTARFAIISTLIESAGLILIILIGLPHIASVNLFEMPNGISGVLSAAALVFFAYIGFEDIVKLSEETRDAERIIPLSLILAVFITTIIYILVALAAIGVMGWQALGSSAAPLADVAAKVFGAKAFFALSIIALFATSNTVLLFITATSRLIYGMGKENSLPNILSAVHKSRRTPHIAIFAAVLFAIIFAFSKNIEFVANVTVFAIFITFAVINATVILLRYKWPGARRPFKVPLSIGNFPILPLFGIVVSLLMIFSLDFLVIAYGIILAALGFAVYELKSLFRKTAAA